MEKDDIKRSLISFGYRINPNTNGKLFSKPLAFLNICVLIDDDNNTINFKTFFRQPETEELHIFSERIIDINDFIELENFEDISRKIAYVEFDLLASYNPISCGLGTKPFNFLTILEQTTYFF